MVFSLFPFILAFSAPLRQPRHISLRITALETDGALTYSQIEPD